MARRASITGLVPAYSSTPGRSLRTMSGFQLASVGALPFPLTLTLNEIFHNLNRPGLPGGAFRSARKAEIGLEAVMRRRNSLGKPPGRGIWRSRPKPAVQSLTDRRGAASPNRPSVHRAAFSEDEGRQRGRSGRSDFCRLRDCYRHCALINHRRFSGSDR